MVGERNVHALSALASLAAHEQARTQACGVTQLPSRTRKACRGLDLLRIQRLTCAFS